MQRLKQLGYHIDAIVAVTETDDSIDFRIQSTSCLLDQHLRTSDTGTLYLGINAYVLDEADTHTLAQKTHTLIQTIEQNCATYGLLRKALACITDLQKGQQPPLSFTAAYQAIQKKHNLPDATLTSFDNTTRLLRELLENNKPNGQCIRIRDTSTYSRLLNPNGKPLFDTPEEYETGTASGEAFKTSLAKYF